jgi:multicomponent Na+:H+ antiporter subunit E
VQSRRARTARRVTGLAWLVLVWVLLWGTWTVGTALAGVIVAVAVTGLLPLAKVELARQLRPMGLLVLLLLFARDLVVASVQVAWLALRPGPAPRSAVIGTRLRTSSDLVLTMVTELVTLVPGSVVIEVSQSAHSLYAHVLDITSPEEAAAFRTRVHAVEARVVRAIGTDDDLRELGRGRS